MRAAIGLPSRVAGSNLNCFAAATAASSKPWPAGCSTSASLTVPSASTRKRSITSAVRPELRASGGYGASTKCTSRGGTTPAAAGEPVAGGASGDDVPRNDVPGCEATGGALTGAGAAPGGDAAGGDAAPCASASGAAADSTAYRTEPTAQVCRSTEAFLGSSLSGKGRKR